MFLWTALLSTAFLVIAFCFLGYYHPDRVPLLSAVASLSVAVMAIWGEQVRRLVAGPKLEILPENFRPNPTVRSNGKKTVFYHLKLTNNRKWAPAKGVKVMLTKAEKLDPNGRFSEVLKFVPSQLVWVPGHMPQHDKTIANYEILDLCHVDEDATHFSPKLYSCPNNFQGYVNSGETVRWYFEIHAENYYSSMLYGVEIHWDGKWSHDPNIMNQHLIFREAPSCAT